MNEYIDGSHHFNGWGNGDITKENGWKLWDCNKELIDRFVCETADERYIDGSNKGGTLYFADIKCGQGNSIMTHNAVGAKTGRHGCCNPRPDGKSHPDRLVLGDKNFLGKDENGEIVIGRHPKLEFANRNPNFVKIQIAQAVVAQRDRNNINVWGLGKPNIKPKFYEMVSEMVGEMSVQIASEYADDYRG